MSAKLVLCAVIASVPALLAAHHSAPAHYNSEAIVTLEGTIDEFYFRNPHSFIHMEVANDQGEAEIWAVEWGNTVAMARRGVSADTFKPGDFIIVTGEMSWDGTRRVNLLKIVRPADGFERERQGAA